MDRVYVRRAGNAAEINTSDALRRRSVQTSANDDLHGLRLFKQTRVSTHNDCPSVRTTRRRVAFLQCCTAHVAMITRLMYFIACTPPTTECVRNNTQNTIGDSRRLTRTRLPKIIWEQAASPPLLADSAQLFNRIC